MARNPNKADGPEVSERIKAWAYRRACWIRHAVTPHFTWKFSGDRDDPWFFCCRFNVLYIRVFDVTWMRDKIFEPPLVIFTLLHVELVRNRPEVWMWEMESPLADRIREARGAMNGA